MAKVDVLASFSTTTKNEYVGSEAEGTYAVESTDAAVVGKFCKEREVTP
jgi:hypothetical protein